MGKYFGTDGIRRKASEFSEDFLRRIALSLIEEIKNKGRTARILIGGDTRESTEYIIKTLTSILMENQVYLYDAGVIPTPAISFLTKELDCDASIMVTASHNPYEDNGIKILNEKGLKIDEAFEEKLEERMDKIELKKYKAHHPFAFYRYCHEEAIIRYKSHLLKTVGSGLDGLSIMLDCANGATGVVAEDIFNFLGANVYTINDDTEFGRKINDGCGSTHLDELKRLLPPNTDFGVAFDGDGDRALFICRDKNGDIKEIDGDHLIAVILNDELIRNPEEKKVLVTTVMANQGLINWAKENEIGYCITNVGDSIVKEVMSSLGAPIGGEQSGHIILKDQNTGDGLLTALTIARIVLESNKSLAELSSIVTKLPQRIINISASIEDKKMIKTTKITNYISDINKLLQGDVNDISDISQFGLEIINIKGGRVNLRPSGTEELIRLTIECPTEKEIDILAGEILNNIGLDLKYENGQVLKLKR